MLRNTATSYGWASILFHWATVLAIACLFPLGLYMMTLDYYDPSYRTLPGLHKGIGVILLLLVSVRLCWRLGSTQPSALPNHARWEQLLAHITHKLLYVLIFAVILSGYLISTADGQPLVVFGLVSIPPTLTHLPNQASIAGKLHLILAISLVSLVGLHMLGALKHHFFNHDQTLLRMLRPGK